MVRVKAEVEVSNIKFETSVLLNTGFGTEEPEALIPIRLAEALGIELEKASPKLYETPGGITRLFEAEKMAEIKVAGKSVSCNVVISETESEVILSDSAISRLEIVIEDPARGLWRFKGEKRTRKSVRPNYW